MTTSNNVPMTATKAHASAFVVVAMAVLAYFGVGEMPDAEPLAEALETVGGLIAYAVGTLITAGVTWVTTYFTSNKPKDGTTLSCHPASLVIALAMVGILATGCESYGTDRTGQTLSHEQMAFKVTSDLTALQVAALAVVTDPATPESVKQAIKDSEALAYHGVTAYVDAVRDGSDDTTALLSSAMAGLLALFDVISANGGEVFGLQLLSEAGHGPPAVVAFIVSTPTGRQA